MRGGARQNAARSRGRLKRYRNPSKRGPSFSGSNPRMKRWGAGAMRASAPSIQGPKRARGPAAAGGDTDNTFRPFTPAFQKALGATVVIANVTGASGTVGAREAKNSPPDGYPASAPASSGAQ